MAVVLPNEALNAHISMMGNPVVFTSQVFTRNSKTRNSLANEGEYSNCADGAKMNTEIFKVLQN